MASPRPSSYPKDQVPAQSGHTSGDSSEPNDGPASLAPYGDVAGNARDKINRGIEENTNPSKGASDRPEAQAVSGTAAGVAEPSGPVTPYGTARAPLGGQGTMGRVPSR